MRDRPPGQNKANDKATLWRKRGNGRELTRGSGSASNTPPRGDTSVLPEIYNAEELVEKGGRAEQKRKVGTGGGGVA